ncbi:MAG: 4'-phosphopantetheinyl transferase superfamily protein [Rhodospirillales bacterium]|nr:4'-phosphopantetheinyl transferase superfamily protein [Rhodospirillales bacterium]
MTPGSTAHEITAWLLPTAGLDDAMIAAWRPLLDAGEQARADRFVFDRHRRTFVAAHALLRLRLAEACGVAPAALRFEPGAHGKPTAWIGGTPAPLSFHLSHTEGLVGLAVTPVAGCALGFDVEALDRRVTLDVADRYFRPEEVAWLHGLPAAAQAEGFLRLWTLKEAFIKATGDGLACDLASFWFEPLLPRVHFTPALPERAEAWWFGQRLAGGFVAAVGLRAAGSPVSVHWRELDPTGRAAFR